MHVSFICWLNDEVANRVCGKSSDRGKTYDGENCELSSFGIAGKHKPDGLCDVSEA